jgi:hypothetical protein
VGADDGTVADPTPYGTEFTAADEMDIPRFDLPFGVASWQGTAAGSSSRDGDKKIIWQAP